MEVKQYKQTNIYFIYIDGISSISMISDLFHIPMDKFIKVYTSHNAHYTSSLGWYFKNKNDAQKCIISLKLLKK